MQPHIMHAQQCTAPCQVDASAQLHACRSVLMGAAKKQRRSREERVSGSVAGAPVVLEALDDARVVADHGVHRVALVPAHVLRSARTHAVRT